MAFIQPRRALKDFEAKGFALGNDFLANDAIQDMIPFWMCCLENSGPCSHVVPKDDGRSNLVPFQNTTKHEAKLAKLPVEGLTSDNKQIGHQAFKEKAIFGAENALRIGQYSCL